MIFRISSDFTGIFCCILKGAYIQGDTVISEILPYCFMWRTIERKQLLKIFTMKKGALVYRRCNLSTRQRLIFVYVDIAVIGEFISTFALCWQIIDLHKKLLINLHKWGGGRMLFIISLSSPYSAFLFWGNVFFCSRGVFQSRLQYYAEVYFYHFC